MAHCMHRAGATNIQNLLYNIPLCLSLRDPGFALSLCVQGAVAACLPAYNFSAVFLECVCLFLYMFCMKHPLWYVQFGTQTQHTDHGD